MRQHLMYSGKISSLPRLVSFNVRVLPRSYIYSIVITFIFAILINLCMTGKLERVSMTESLKSVD